MCRTPAAQMYHETYWHLHLQTSSSCTSDRTSTYTSTTGAKTCSCMITLQIWHKDVAMGLDLSQLTHCTCDSQSKQHNIDHMETLTCCCYDRPVLCRVDTQQGVCLHLDSLQSSSTACKIGQQILANPKVIVDSRNCLRALKSEEHTESCMQCSLACTTDHEDSLQEDTFSLSVI